MNISFSPPDITDLEIQEIIAAMKSGWITTGPKTKLFEKKIAEYCGTSKAVCLNSATAALEMMLRMLGVGPGDEVITSAYTYTASASVIVHVGAKIVLVDVAAGSFQMDYEKLAEAITEKTKVIIPVDIGGVMCDYDAIHQAVEGKKHLYHPRDNEYQRLFDRPIIVADAAHSFGATYHGNISGAVADFSCFSFHAVKNLTTAEGGAITWRDRAGLDNDSLYNQFMLWSLHGQSKDALAKMRPGAWEYDIVYPAYKCNMTDITAAIGLVQISRFDGLMAKRKRFIQMYDDALLPLGIRRLQHYGDDFEGNGHLYMMRLTGISEQRRNEIIVKMAEAGVACNVHFKPLPMHTAYKRLGFDINDYPNAYRQYANEITLPMHTLLTEEQVRFVSETLKGILEGYEPRALYEDELEIKRVWDTSYDDMHSVYDIIKECGERMFMDDGLLHWATPLPVDFIRRECLEKEVYLVNSKKSGKPLATFNITGHPSMYFDMDKKALYMQRLAVTSEYWNKGIGTQCFQFLVDRAKRDGCECVRSLVYEASDRAVTFLKRRGYRELYKRLSKHFGVLCMEREL
jgi:dTDP-4-amino-4,6-dideoxygalactose transaminase/GNAT superfamily N-acetyltransferase